jgi:hypothetical protein
VIGDVTIAIDLPTKREARVSLFRQLVILLLSTAQATILLPQNFMSAGTNIFYEAIGDSRSTNTLNPHSPATPLNYLGFSSDIGSGTYVCTSWTISIRAR